MSPWFDWDVVLAFCSLPMRSLFAYFGNADTFHDPQCMSVIWNVLSTYNEHEYRADLLPRVPKVYKVDLECAEIACIHPSNMSRHFCIVIKYVSPYIHASSNSKSLANAVNFLPRAADQTSTLILIQDTSLEYVLASRRINRPSTSTLHNQSQRCQLI